MILAVHPPLWSRSDGGKARSDQPALLQEHDGTSPLEKCVFYSLNGARGFGSAKNDGRYREPIWGRVCCSLIGFRRVDRAARRRGGGGEVKRTSRFFSAACCAGLLVAGIFTAGCGTKQKADSKALQPQPVSLGETATLGTTDGIESSGLLKALVPAFEQKLGIKVKVVSGQLDKVVRMGRRGEVDLLLIDSKKAEDALMDEELGKSRLAVMRSDFLIVGPASDPAGVRGGASAQGALYRIAQLKATFVSGLGASGVNVKELELWKTLGVEPAGKWYLKKGSGSVGALRSASTSKAYTLVDRGTWLSQKSTLDLVPIVEGDKSLVDKYALIVLDPSKHTSSSTRIALSRGFADWLVGADAQNLIGDFGQKTYGQWAFSPDSTASAASK